MKIGDYVEYRGNNQGLRYDPRFIGLKMQIVAFTDSGIAQARTLEGVIVRFSKYNLKQCAPHNLDMEEWELIKNLNPDIYV